MEHVVDERQVDLLQEDSDRRTRPARPAPWFPCPARWPSRRCDPAAPARRRRRTPFRRALTDCTNGNVKTPVPAPMSATNWPGLSLSAASVSGIFRPATRFGDSSVLIHSSAERDASCAAAGAARPTASSTASEQPEKFSETITNSLSLKPSALSRKPCLAHGPVLNALNYLISIEHRLHVRLQPERLILRHREASRRRVGLRRFLGRLAGFLRARIWFEEASIEVGIFRRSSNVICVLWPVTIVSASLSAPHAPSSGVSAISRPLPPLLASRSGSWLFDAKMSPAETIRSPGNSTQASPLVWPRPK